MSRAADKLRQVLQCILKKEEAPPPPPPDTRPIHEQHPEILEWRVDDLLEVAYYNKPSAIYYFKAIDSDGDMVVRQYGEDHYQQWSGWYAMKSGMVKNLSLKDRRALKARADATQYMIDIGIWRPDGKAT